MSAADQNDELSAATSAPGPDIGTLPGSGRSQLRLGRQLPTQVRHSSLYPVLAEVWPLAAVRNVRFRVMQFARRCDAVANNASGRSAKQRDRWRFLAASFVGLDPASHRDVEPL